MMTTRKAQANYFLNETIHNLNKPKTFWKHIDYFRCKKKPVGLPLYIMDNKKSKIKVSRSCSGKDAGDER